MKNESYLRYLLSDTLSLRKYYRIHKEVDLEDVKRSVLCQVREQKYAIPDHYYRLGIELSFRNITKLSELFTVGLSGLTEEYLEFHHDQVYVKGNRMNDWQMLLPHIPPLILVVVQIWKKFGPIIEPMTEYIHRYIQPSVKFTAIPPAYLPEMETIKQEHNGFDDLHIHLNGTIEADLAWQDMLRRPEQVYDKIRKVYSKGKVLEQLEQLTEISDPIEFLSLFRIAGNIRYWLFNVVERGVNIYDDKCKDQSFENILSIWANGHEYNREHPYVIILGKDAFPLLLESIFYVRVLDYLTKYPNNQIVAGAFHYYLLILGFCNRLLVQQLNLFGFEQFQKYTLNNLREFSEETTFYQRFLQLMGNDLKNIHHIEGRFTPKNTIETNIAYIHKITNGFAILNRHQNRTGIACSTLSLIAHFIKQQDDEKDDIRFKKLRIELQQKTDALIALLNTQSCYGQMIKGVDAAASEFDTPPSVFAPVFQQLRERGGMQHFTFHAGEDFFHIISGLRAIYEAVYFLELQPGDRIGHATASGIDVDLWRANIGESILMYKEDYMDDLVFAYHLITSYKEKSLEHLLPIIALKVENYASQIYVSTYSISDLIEGWKERKKDPLLMDETIDSVVAAQKIHQAYHTREVRKRGKEIVSIDTYDIFGPQDLVCLQQLLLKFMHQKQIVIETLPTSNIIIGQHHGFESHHLYNWYKWGKDGLKVPAIVVGSDDAGIFATNIYNEYCHIYCLLTFDKGLSHHETIAYIERLMHNAKVYAF